MQRKNKPENTVSFGDMLFSLAETAFISVFVMTLFFTYILRPVTVSGDSMLPTLVSGDNVMLASFFCSAEVGDIVVADCQKAVLLSDENTPEYRDGLHKMIVKRVIADEGQTVYIDFEKGLVYVDGVMLDEPYISGLTHLDGGAFTGKYPVTVPEGFLFLMGDNRENSRDSRDSGIGFVSKEDIIGKVVLRISPTDRTGFF